MKYSYSVSNYDKEKTAMALGVSLGISFKHAKEVCDYVRGKKAKDAIAILEKVASMEAAVPYTKYKHDLAHKRKVGPGRYPVNTAENIIIIIKSAVANANHKGLNGSEMVVKHISAQSAAKPWHAGRHARRKMKRAHIEVLLAEGNAVEKKAAKKGETKTAKPAKAAAKTGKENKTHKGAN